MLPVWEEMLFLNENFNYCIQEKPRAILIFEVSCVESLYMLLREMHRGVALLQHS